MAISQAKSQLLTNYLSSCGLPVCNPIYLIEDKSATYYRACYRVLKDAEANKLIGVEYQVARPGYAIFSIKVTEYHKRGHPSKLYQNADAIQRLEELGLLDKQKFYFNLDKVEFSQ